MDASFLTIKNWAEYITSGAKVKIADYTHRTTNRAPGIITLPLASFSYFASKISSVKVQNAFVYSLADEVIDEE